jgi:hypothetical protein
MEASLKEHAFEPIVDADRPESGLSISSGQTDFDDENSIIIRVDNWTTIKRVPSLVRPQGGDEDGTMQQTEIDSGIEGIAREEQEEGRLGTPLLGLKRFVEEPQSIDSSLLHGNGNGQVKDDSGVPSLATINSLYGGILASGSLNRV